MNRRTGADRAELHRVRPVSLLVAVLAGVALIGSTLLIAQTVCFREIVTESDVSRQPEDSFPLRNWVLYFRFPLTGTGAFVLGPEHPPMGVGSLEFETMTDADKVTLFNFDHVGTPLSSIDAIGYSTYRDSISVTTHPAQVPSINIQVDYNGADPAGFTTLVFEPVYNTDQGSVTPDVWQDWDAYKGGNAIWWSTRPIGGCLFPPCYMTWNYIIANNPNATILGGFGVNQGSGNGGLTASTDALHLSYTGQCVTYDFEPFRSTNQCKKGGWQTMRRADGTEFKNQGDCVSYVNTGK